MYYIDDEDDQQVHRVFRYHPHGKAHAYCGNSVLTEMHQFFTELPEGYRLCENCNLGLKPVEGYR